MPMVSITHWGPETATTEPPPESDGTVESFNERHGVPRVLPRCPKCHKVVEGYVWPKSEGVQTIMDEWRDTPHIRLRPCNHSVEPEAIGIHNYEVRLLAPRP